MEKPKRIILIDDDYSNNLICKIIINRSLEGIQVLDFTNPQKSLEYILEEYTQNPVPTIILLDINMPELSGWEVMDALGDYPEHIINHLKIFILSSSVDHHDFEKANSDPRIVAYLTKPLMAPKLKELYEQL